MFLTRLYLVSDFDDINEINFNFYHFNESKSLIWQFTVISILVYDLTFLCAFQAASSRYLGLVCSV